jgi:RNA recognition motif-containing protein
MKNKLYVGNISYTVTAESLTALFTEAGAVTSARVVTDKMSGKSKGFAFVEMASEADAEAVIAKFDAQEFEGRNLRVMQAKEQDPNAPRPARREGGFGGRSGGGFGGNRDGGGGGGRGFGGGREGGGGGGRGFGGGRDGGGGGGRSFGGGSRDGGGNGGGRGFGGGGNRDDNFGNE